MSFLRPAITIVALSAALNSASSQNPDSAIVKALEGKAPNVDTTRPSGKPGESGCIQIRDGGLDPARQPLFVVDGLPVSLLVLCSDFDPADIETVDILKSTAAAAIYGAPAANGAVLITTKYPHVRCAIVHATDSKRHTECRTGPRITLVILNGTPLDGISPSVVQTTAVCFDLRDLVRIEVHRATSPAPDSSALSRAGVVEITLHDPVAHKCDPP
jgi:TonB-dependent SusC/RagA subfamily outer membrane receptor